ncbi:hypothetical protein EDB85DRAFT_1894677 [Lactarius pseudohatsudake]|nr:hypothetical protein EDB85DRAFT_1894677 [Lactarius pseudohatsudake]
MAASSIEVDTERHDAQVPTRLYLTVALAYMRAKNVAMSTGRAGGLGERSGTVHRRRRVSPMICRLRKERSGAVIGGRCSLAAYAKGRVNNDIILPLRLVWVISELEVGLKYHQVTAAYSMVKSQSHTSTSPSDAPAPPANAFNAPPPLPSRGGAYSVQHTHIRGRQRSTCREVTRRSGTRAWRQQRAERKALHSLPLPDRRSGHRYNANDVEHNDKGMIISVNSERARHRTSYRRPEGIVI